MARLITVTLTEIPGRNLISKAGIEILKILLLLGDLGQITYPLRASVSMVKWESCPTSASREVLGFHR